jgi:hypothetical protein
LWTSARDVEGQTGASEIVRRGSLQWGSSLATRELSIGGMLFKEAQKARKSVGSGNNSGAVERRRRNSISLSPALTLSASFVRRRALFGVEVSGFNISMFSG